MADGEEEPRGEELVGGGFGWVGLFLIVHIISGI
jgi:hypothetical protein